jgi:hypothetical protein
MPEVVCQPAPSSKVGLILTYESDPSSPESLSPPPPFATGVSALAITLGSFSTCVMVNGGGVKCWGYNDYGQLGIGSMGDRYRPTDVPGG